MSGDQGTRDVLHAFINSIDVFALEEILELSTRYIVTAAVLIHTEREICVLKDGVPRTTSASTYTPCTCASNSHHQQQPGSMSLVGLNFSSLVLAPLIHFFRTTAGTH